MLYMFRWHSRQNERVTGTSEGHDLQTSPGESCMCVPTKGAAGETYSQLLFILLGIVLFFLTHCK